MRPVPYETIMTLEVETIRLTFPSGVVQVGKGDRWEPASKKADRTLARLLRDKKERQERPRYLAASSAHKLRWDKRLERWEPAPAHPDQDIGYTDTPYGAMRPDAGEAVDEVTQQRLTHEAQERHRATHKAEIDEREMRSALNQLKQLCLERAKMGLSPTPVIKEAIGALKSKKAA